MDRKRKVSDNSGRTQHRHANEIYNEIRKVRGNTKSCPFYGGSTYSGRTRALLIENERLIFKCSIPCLSVVQAHSLYRCCYEISPVLEIGVTDYLHDARRYKQQSNWNALRLREAAQTIRCMWRTQKPNIANELVKSFHANSIQRTSSTLHTSTPHVRLGASDPVKVLVSKDCRGGDAEAEGERKSRPRDI